MSELRHLWYRTNSNKSAQGPYLALLEDNTAYPIVGFEGCVRALLEARTPPDIHDMAGFTALIIAARNGHDNIVKLLIHFGSKVNRLVQGHVKMVIVSYRHWLQRLQKPWPGQHNFNFFIHLINGFTRVCKPAMPPVCFEQGGWVILGILMKYISTPRDSDMAWSSNIDCGILTLTFITKWVRSLEIMKDSDIQPWPMVVFVTQCCSCVRIPKVWLLRFLWYCHSV